MKTLKNKLQSGQPMVFGWSAIGSAFSTEILAHTNADGIIIDTQHALGTDNDLLNSLQASRSGGKETIIRVRWNEPASIMRALDFGAIGIICPMVNTREDAENFVNACRYSPRGSRSYGPIRAGLTYGADYYKNANDSVVTIAMIETRHALENVEDILDVEELDGLFIGPNDLGVELGVGPVMDEPNEILDNAVEHIINCARKAGKFAGIFSGSAEGAKRRFAQGCNFAPLGSDGMYLRQMAAKINNDLKDIQS